MNAPTLSPPSDVPVKALSLAALAAALTLAMMGRAAGMLVAAMAVAYAVWAVRGEASASARRVLPAYAVAFAVQCAHLAEEYATDFNRAFPPLLGAHAWSERRFLAFNLAWLAVFAAAGFGVARGSRLAYLVALFLAIGGGIGNGLGHLALVAWTGGYFPGAYTAVLSLAAGCVLAYRLLRTERSRSPDCAQAVAGASDA